MGLNVTKLSIDEWISVTQTKGEKLNIPITLHSTSGSMIPTIRMDVDEVIVVPCEINEVRVGDIVLINTPHRGAGVLLHRLYKMKDGNIITVGDNMKSLDPAVYSDKLLGRAVSISGPGKNIDCDSSWRRLQGKIIVHSYWLRPITFLVRRVFRKLGCILGIVK